MKMINDKKRCKKQLGFTLVELMIVTLIFSVVTAAVYSLYITNQKTAYIQDDLVDVQQNIRIAIDNITRDVMHAGFSISQLRNSNDNATLQPLTGPTVTPPINDILNTAGTTSLPDTADVFPGKPAAVHADYIVLNVASPFLQYAKLAASFDWFTAGGNVQTFTVTTPESVDNFNLNDMVRIINPTLRKEPTACETLVLGGGGPGAGTAILGTIFEVTGLDRNAQTITLTYRAGRHPSSACNPNYPRYSEGDLIAKVRSNLTDPFPNTVTYCIGPSADCASDTTACPSRGPNDQARCLIRIVNEYVVNPAPDVQVIASGISGLQLSYMLDNGTEVPNTSQLLPLPDLGAVRAVRVAVAGQTAKATALSSGPSTTILQEKTRSLSSIVKVRNRFRL